ncbi:hypothetical protein J3R83DRAFT_785 [Lanmaoa asiatica]|nr:hypothetical protein J3R83DRAFT_785 [Lanmaoa asiatica]
MSLTTTSRSRSSAAQLYPTYQRGLSGPAVPAGDPLNDYTQAIPEIALSIKYLVISHKGREGETTNQISTLAACTNKLKLEAFGELVETIISIYKRIVEIPRSLRSV